MDTAALAAFVREAAAADRVAITPGTRLSGGAIQENIALTVAIEGGPQAGTHALVLRAPARAAVPASRSIDQQFALLAAAHRAGVPVPEPLWFSADPAVIGRPFYLMRRLAGIALGTRVVRDGPHPALAADLATALASLHRITPPSHGLGFLEAPAPSPARHWLVRLRAWLDALPEPHPVIEWGLRWLETRAPAKAEIVLCHHDFRTGNYLVADGRLAGVLDWEFAGWSDPHEDIGWFTAKCWRFGADRLEAGGIEGRDAFYAAYTARSGRAIEDARVRYYEVMAHARWAVIAAQQAMRHRSGAEPSLELALVGRRLAELEHEILVLTGER
ncbi:MAG: phosphotransferase family protein [Alphaproteobacteria bacterium]|nr:phosphotransferase family protein [Alphaproteobacteria bacterium]